MILAIDTSTQALSVALVSDQTVLGEFSTTIKKTHSVQAMAAVEQLLAHCNANPTDITKIVVAKGPGSYTGVRIGVTLAKTLAWTLGTELVGISSLEALAQNGACSSGYIAPIIDARRGQVFTSLFKSKNGQLTRISNDQIVLCDKWTTELAELNEPVLFIGADTLIHQQTITTILGSKAHFAHAAITMPRASQLAHLGKDRPSEDIHSFTPNYARLAEAETNWLAAQNEGKL